MKHKLFSNSSSTKWETFTFLPKKIYRSDSIILWVANFQNFSTFEDLMAYYILEKINLTLKHIINWYRKSVDQITFWSRTKVCHQMEKSKQFDKLFHYTSNFWVFFKYLREHHLWNTFIKGIIFDEKVT